MATCLLSVLLPLAQAYDVPGTSKNIEVEVDMPQVLAKFGLILAAGLVGAGLLPWLLRKSQSVQVRAFRLGTIYALGPALIAAAGVGSAASGVTLEMLRQAPLARVWPLPLAILGLTITGEALGGLLGLLFERQPGGAREARP